MRGLIAKVILLALMTLSFSAFSQEWIESRRTGDGPGINLGNNVAFHLGLGLEGGYNSNVFRRSKDLPNENVEGAARLRVSPYFDLATRPQEERVEDEGVSDPTPPKFEFKLGLGTWFDAYFSEDARAREQSYFGIDLHFNFIAFPGSPLSILLDATYVRTLEPYESAFDQWASHWIHPGIGLRFRPGGGTLSFEVGYRADLKLFEDDSIAERNDKLTNEVRFITSWNFLPKTALVQKTLFSPIVYLGEVNRNDATQINADSFPVRAQLGMRGLLSDKYGLSLFVGYGASFYETGDDFDGVIANLEFKFFITSASNLRIGGIRDFVDSYYANFFVKNGGYLMFEQMIANIVLLSLRGDAFYRVYSTNEMGLDDNLDVGESRSEVWIGATLFIEARATNWLTFCVSGTYQGNVTDFAYVVTPDVFPMDFNRFEIMGGARVYY
ncbi:MAG: hypothetical protein GY762_02765 [Proteobacteria bacterium]|nr:hypothetical protein [Pseudomonadota bacterium]